MLLGSVRWLLSTTCAAATASIHASALIPATVGMHSAKADTASCSQHTQKQSPARPAHTYLAAPVASAAVTAAHLVVVAVLLLHRLVTLTVVA